MEFDFDVNALFSENITRTVGGRLSANRNQNEKMRLVVDKMGVASAKAQGLNAPITTFQKLQCSNQVLYVMKDEGRSNDDRGAVVGILKIGTKRLFLNDSSGVHREVEPMCVLDFYVHESKQRSGCGKRLFEAMLKSEGLKPFEVAIDRPSPKFLSFLKKHYKLQSYMKQANNYVVFDQFFTTCVEIPRTSRRLSLQRDGAERYSFISPSKQDKQLPNTFPFSNTAPTSSPFGAHQENKTVIRDSPFRNKRDSLSNDFNWSPDIKTHTTTQPLSSRMAQTSQRHTFNIITGAPLLSCDNSTSNQTHRTTHNQEPVTNCVRFASRLKEIKDGGENDTAVLSDQILSSDETDRVAVHCRHQPKAPHLNMRHNKNRAAVTAMFNVPSQSSSMANTTSLPGYYTSRRESLREIRGPTNYSRYSTMDGGHDNESILRGESGKRGLLNAAGLLGTHYPPAKSKLKDKWRDYIT